MAKKTTKSKAWKQFERRIGNLYRELGAREVEVDKDVAGNQIDVFAVVPRIDGTFSRDIISCKCYNCNAGIKDVREWYEVFQVCHRANAADQAVVVTNRDFSRNAKTLAKEVGIHLRTVEQLKWASVDLVPYLEDVRARIASERVFKDNIYVPLRFVHEGNTREVTQDALIKRFLSRGSCPLLTLLGDYGSGKTTLSKNIFLGQSRRFLDNDQKARIPIYLNLRDYAGHLNAPGFILDVLVNQHNARCPNYAKIRQLIINGNVLLIFDAFDEMISRGSYDDTLRNFQAVLGVLEGKSKAILTCRTNYFKSPHEIHDAHKGTELFQITESNAYEIAYIQPFSEDDIQSVVKSSCGDSAEDVMQRVRSTYDLMGLARRPILLQMITAVVEDVIDSPEAIDNARLYNKYVNQWLLRDDWRVRLARELRRSFTIAFATEMYVHEKLQFTLEELSIAIRRHFPNTTPDLLHAYDNDIRLCSFIRLDGDRCEFVHRSFVEYFVALQLYRDIVSDDSERLSSVRFTREILSFLSQQFPTEEVRRNIQKWLANTRGNEVLAANTMGLLQAWERGLTGTIKGLRVKRVGHGNPNLVDCQLVEVGAFDLDLENVDWTRSRSSRGEWSSCTWRDPVFHEMVFIEDQFQNTQFRNAQFAKAQWERCTFDNALFDSRESGNVLFQECAFTKCDFRPTRTRMRAINCSFKGCQFAALAELTACKVTDSNFEQSDLSSASLMGTVFEKTRFVRVTLSANCLDGAKFIDVDLSDTRLEVTGSRRWEKPPEFFAKSGLSERDIQRLKRRRAKFRDEVPSSEEE